MGKFFTPFSWGRKLAISKETEGAWLILAMHHEEEGEPYLAEECRKAAKEAAAARAAKEVAETNAIDFRFRAPEQGESSKKEAAEEEKKAGQA